MESPLWHLVGNAAVIAFVIAILLIVVARRWFASSDAGKVRRGAQILSALGGAYNARQTTSEMRRRNVT